MTGGVAGPNLGLVADFDDGENGWGVLGNDPNMHLIDAVLHLGVTNATTATPPGTPAAGDRYIVAATATGAWAGKEGQIAVYRATPTAGWTFYPPAASWTCLDLSTGRMLRYDGSAWGRLDRFTIFFFAPGKPAAGALLLRINLPEGLKLPASMTSPEFQVSAEVAATAAASISVKVNGTEEATIDFAAAGTAGTWTSAGATATAGQALTLYAPATQDATLADLSFTLVFDYA